MIYRYEIKNNGTEDIIYLYVTMTYEFSKELEDNKTTKVKSTCKNFIKNNSINFEGNKIYLVIDGIIVKTISIEDDEKNSKETKETEEDFSNNNFHVNLHFPNNKTMEVTLRDYLLGVIATNTIENLELTTIKALCVLYRTYAYKEMQEKNYIETINNFLVYKPLSYYKILWKEKYTDYYNKFIKAIEDTDKEFITYNNKYINPYIHISNNGYTDTKENIDYLEKRPSLWDYASPYYLEIKDFSNQEIENIFNIEATDLKSIKILEVSNSNYIRKIKIGNKEYSGNEIKEKLGLKSTDITIIINPTYIRFITKGWGNNLGISQFGANEIAKVGCSYTSILKYYFPKVSIKKYT